MFSSGPNYTKLKTNLKLCMSRLKLLQRKKIEQTEKMRREIANYLENGKIERAKIRVEYIIREDYLVEAMEMVEMYCDLLSARFGLIRDMAELDDGIAEAVSSLIWVGPRLQSDCQELKIVADVLAKKYGDKYADSCRTETVGTVNEHLKHKLSIQAPAKILIEKYVIEIAKCFNVPYEPDEQIMNEAKDAVLIDLSDKNTFGGGGGGFPQFGFIGYPQAPPLPTNANFPGPYNPNFVPDPAGGGGGVPSAPPPMANTTNFYNIPPSNDGSDVLQNENKDTSYNKNLNDEPQKPSLPPKMDGNNFNILDLPSVPNRPNVPTTTAASSSNLSDTNNVDFDDLNRRFMELKKKY